MTIIRADLLRLAAASGFQPDALEKVLHLLALLGAIRAHPYLGTRVALKGGTALNLFALDAPRLSVDVDLNYIGAADRATMLAERPQLERALRDVCERLHITVHRAPGDFAGGKWRLSYAASGGGRGTLELDVNFVLRTPLWPPTMVTSNALPGLPPVAFPVLDPHELAAGKLAALLARGASRDLFDTRALLQRGGFDSVKLRLAFVVYGGANRVDWRTVDAAQVTTTPEDVSQRLLPLLRTDLIPPPADLARWTGRLVSESVALLSAVLPFTSGELAFLEQLNGAGEIAPELLTDDERLHVILRIHPGLRWKALNVGRRLAGEAAPANEEPTA